MKNNTLWRYSRTLFLGTLLVTGVLRPEGAMAEVYLDPLLDGAVPEASVCPNESSDPLSMLVIFLQGEETPINGCPDKTVAPQTKCDKITLNENLDALERRLCKGAKELLAPCDEEAGPCIKCRKGENLPTSPNAKCLKKTDAPTPDCGPLNVVTAPDGTKNFCVTANGKCQYKCT